MQMTFFNPIALYLMCDFLSYESVSHGLWTAACWETLVYESFRLSQIFKSH